MEPQKNKPPLPKGQLAALLLVLVGGAAWMFWPKAIPENDVEQNDGENAGEEEVAHASEEEETAAADVDPENAQPRLKIAGWQGWTALQNKVESIQRLSIENEKLAVENANLRRWIMANDFRCQETHSKKRTQQTSSTLLKQTGSPVGRALASLDYRPPMHLLPGQLYTLGISYFNQREDEKAAVIFTYLSELEDQPQYKTVAMDVLIGVAWYRLQNLKLADRYFEQALHRPEAVAERPQTLKHLARARLWRAIVSHRLGREKDTQKWLRNLAMHHPHAAETKWVNRRAH